MVEQDRGAAKAFTKLKKADEKDVFLVFPVFVIRNAANAIDAMSLGVTTYKSGPLAATDRIGIFLKISNENDADVTIKLSQNHTDKSKAWYTFTAKAKGSASAKDNTFVFKGVTVVKVDFWDLTHAEFPDYVLKDHKEGIYQADQNGNVAVTLTKTKSEVLVTFEKVRIV